MLEEAMKNKIVLLAVFVVFVSLSASLASGDIWDSYPYRYEIISDATGTWVINVNDTYAPGAWTANASTGDIKYLYCAVSNCMDGNWSIGNTSDELRWENETSGTGININDMWKTVNAQYILHFNDTAKAFDSAGTADGTNAGCDLGTGLFGTGYDFEDINTDSVEIANPTIARTNGWTASFWVKHELATSEDEFYLDARDATDETYMSINTGTGFVRNIINWWTPTAGNFNCLTSSPTKNISDSGWHYLAFVWNTTDKLIYVDGIINCTQVEGTFADQDSNYDIGRDNAGANFFDGIMDEFRLYNESKSAAWVSEQYFNGINNLTTLGAEETIFSEKYNISFFDEMTNKSIDFSANKNGTLRVFCSDRTTHDQIVTGTLHEFIINCTSFDYIWFRLYDPKGDHYRTLMPTADIDNVTFYMINTTPADVTINLVTFLVTDASLLYPAGILHFKKVILGEGQKDIIDTTIGSDGKAYANLIGGETYTVSVESSDGANSKTLGEYTTPDTTTTSQPLSIIDITFIPAHNYIGTDISWSMQFNTSIGRIYFYYNDSSENTTSIQFWIYNITNVSANTQMYYDTVSGQSHHLFQWDYVTNGNENDTYLGYFEVSHEIYGNITESRPLAKGGIFFLWLGNIGAWYHIFSIFIIVFVASVFGAKSAPVGVIILAIIAGFLFYIEWLPGIIAGATRLTDLLMIGLIVMAILAMFIIKRRRV